MDEEIDYSQVHDFNGERYRIMVFAGFLIPKEPTWFYLTNLLRVLSIYGVLLYLTSMSILTMTFPFDNKEIPVMVFQNICLLFAAMLTPVIRRISNGSLREAHAAILKGVHKYQEEYENEIDIKKSRVKQIRFLVVLVARLVVVTGIANIFFLPALQYLTITEDTSENILNPYLPLPIYMPFDTRTIFGFSVAFFTHGILWLFLSNTTICTLQIYLSTSYQLIAQIEILINSLKNIEERAWRLMMSSNYVQEQNMSKEILYKMPEYHRCLYLCLRENIMHHQAILRLKNNVRTFVELFNGINMFIFVLVLASTCLLIIENPSINIALAMTLACDVYLYFEFCSLGQIVTDTNGEIRNSIYSMPWYHCNRDFKTLMKTMLLFAQQPMIFRASGINVNISLETYGDMLSAAYKIMNVL